MYLKLAVLPDGIKANWTKSKTRLDCVKHYNLDNYKGLSFFVNPKGQLFFFKTPAVEIVKANTQKRAEWSLTNKSVNLSSIWIELPEFRQYAYGYPSPNKMLGRNKNKPNPLFSFKDDLYLFIINNDYTEIEILIIPDGRNLLNTYYQKLIDGYFDELLEKFRNESKPFFDYGI